MAEDTLESSDLFIMDVLNLPKDLGRAILQTEKDITLFVANFYKTNSLVINDLLDYKSFKVSDNNYSFEQFVSMYEKEGVLTSFTKMFLQDFSHSDIDLITAVISTELMTLEILYTNFMKNIYVNIMRYIMHVIHR